MMLNINRLLENRYARRHHPDRCAAIRSLAQGQIRVTSGPNAGVVGRFVRADRDRILLDAEIAGVSGHPRWAFLRECAPA